MDCLTFVSLFVSIPLNCILFSQLLSSSSSLEIYSVTSSLNREVRAAGWYEGRTERDSQREEKGREIEGLTVQP